MLISGIQKIKLSGAEKRAFARWSNTYSKSAALLYGRQYDPLAKEDPDTTLSLEDREIGGMGILIVKKSIDAVNYEYKDGKIVSFSYFDKHIKSAILHHVHTKKTGK